MLRDSQKTNIVNGAKNGKIIWEKDSQDVRNVEIIVMNGMFMKQQKTQSNMTKWLKAIFTIQDGNVKFIKFGEIYASKILISLIQISHNLVNLIEKN